MKLKAAYIKAPFEFQVREIPLREIGEREVLVRVKACSVCGHDLILAGSGAVDWQPFGHEISGVVEKVGRQVCNVRLGDRVVLESGTFDRYSEHSRNGRVDLDNKGPNFWLKENDTMGFAEFIIVPNEVCVRFEGLTDEEACIVEPLGVALDLVKTADIQLNNDVLVIGLGPIGLMAARLARAMGARHVFGSELSAAEARKNLAVKWGVEQILSPDLEPVEAHVFPRGGVDRVLVTAPPSTIPTAVTVANTGGIIAFLGIDYGPGGHVNIDSNAFHVKKLQLRSSFASPALYFPECIDLIHSGVVRTGELVSHVFKLEEIGPGIRNFRDDRRNGIKAVMTNLT